MYIEDIQYALLDPGDRLINKTWFLLMYSLHSIRKKQLINKKEANIDNMIPNTK